MHPMVKWALILFALILLAAPPLAADIVTGCVDAIQGAVASLKIFGGEVQR